MQRQIAPSVLCIGPFPPPVHGQSVATRDFAASLRDAGLTVTTCDTGESGATGIRSKLLRVVRHATAAWRIFVGNSRCVYLSVNSQSGMAMTRVLARVAVVRGRALFLHHHSYRYIATHDALAEKLAHGAGQAAIHITNCPGMGDELRARYPAIRHTMSYSNVGSVSDALQPAPRRRSRPMTFGHMSNLTEAKGIGRVLEGFAAAKAHWPDLRLILAGPCAESYASEAIAAAQARFGGDLDYRGPVHGDDKLRFFRDIDLFLFPSRYATETQGIVNLEALASGVPVIAFAQCCIGPDIGESGGLALAPDSDFALGLVAYLQDQTDDRDAISTKVRSRFDTLKAQFIVEKRALMQAIIEKSSGTGRE